MKEGEQRPHPDQPQPARESGQPPGVFRAWWRESRLRKLISRQRPPQEIIPINEVQHQHQSAANTLAPHSPDEPSREQVTGEEVHQVFDKWKRRELRKVHRPVSLYDNTYQRERNQLLRYINEAVERGETADDITYRERLEEEEIRIQELRLQRIAGLTPEQQEQVELEDSVCGLRARRTMSGRINFAQSSLDAEQLTKLQQHDPEFMDPIIRGVEMRSARLEKAQRGLQRIYQPPPEDELRPGEQLAVLADLLKKAVAREGVQSFTQFLLDKLNQDKPRQ